ncbi:hypothetical protein HIM_10006 [Hirsutella minnesotensis 3608]|uniref:Protein kinase domain-containing protein n=1 Tax=Hirsutella minnesotensis 3608 TaxID=1043627 RepID=A0A0F7ZS24_9HYPO|nr:hypothetical protein HIM_10006 [Hirsutella minnesotensis 3608]
MVGLRWTYDELVKYFDRSPVPFRDLNPIIKQLLMTCPGSSVFGIGGHSVVLCISLDIAAKVSLRSGDERLRHEQHIFGLLGLSECPQVIRCLFRGVDVTFLELIVNGTLHDRISIKKPRPILQWMLQLSSAAACLEALGYAHGDINPQNILLDDYDQIKLIDFDHSLRVGDMLDIGYEPYVRQHRELSGGIYGIAGPVTEQFALGSVFWYMTRGSELYSDLEGPDQVDRLLDGNFPTTDPQDPIDQIIQNCWHGFYLRIADLVDDIKNILGVGMQVQRVPTPAQRYERKRLCEKYYSLVSPPYMPSTAEGDLRGKEDGCDEPHRV